MSVEDTQQFPVQRPQPTVAADTSTAAAADEAAAALRELAGKAVGLVIGLALLVGCSFAVTRLPEWGERLTMPVVFLVFVLVMMVASQLVVGGAGAVWAAARTKAQH
jgi:hypothetical protein